MGVGGEQLPQGVKNKRRERHDRACTHRRLARPRCTQGVREQAADADRGSAQLARRRAREEAASGLTRRQRVVYSLIAGLIDTPSDLPSAPPARFLFQAEGQRRRGAAQVRFAAGRVIRNAGEAGSGWTDDSSTSSPVLNTVLTAPVFPLPSV